MCTTEVTTTGLELTGFASQSASQNEPLRNKLTYESQLFANQNQCYILIYQLINIDTTILNTFVVFCASLHA